MYIDLIHNDDTHSHGNDFATNFAFLHRNIVSYSHIIKFNLKQLIFGEKTIMELFFAMFACGRQSMINSKVNSQSISDRYEANLFHNQTESKCRNREFGCLIDVEVKLTINNSQTRFM